LDPYAVKQILIDGLTIKYVSKNERGGSVEKFGVKEAKKYS
jgi:hypothetical protein